MMATVKLLDGTTAEFDLDKVTNVLSGYSKEKPDWTCSVVFDPRAKRFIELRSSPQDYRGNSRGEVVELSEDDLSAYGISKERKRNGVSR